MFRDRTNLFVSYRASYTHHPFIPESQSTVAEPLINSDGDGEVIEMERLPPSWLEGAKQLEKAIVQIRNQMGMLSPLHKKNSLPGFDDRTHIEREIEQLTIQITRGLHRCQDIVKQLAQLSATETDPSTQRMARNIQVAMATKLQETSALFRKMQSNYLKALRQDPVDLPGVAPASLEEDVAFSNQTLLQTQTTLQSDHSAEVQQREQEISKIAQGILDVAEIFQDLQTMVIDQGTLLDRIDYNVETMRHHVQNADEQLVKGSRYQKRTQKCKIIILLMLIVVALIFWLIFAPRRHVHHDIEPSPPSQDNQDHPSY